MVYIVGGSTNTKQSLNRTHNVYDLQDMCGDVNANGELDPHATLPFISHHTLNLSRDLKDVAKKSKPLTTSSVTLLTT